MSMSATSIRLLRAVFIGVPSENPMHYHPYASKFDNDIVTALDTITEGGLYTNVERFSTIAGSVIAPQSQSAGKILMPYGWEERRFSMMLEFEVISAAGGVSKEIITGYTGFSDLSMSGHLNPDTPVFANNCSRAVMSNISQDGSRNSQVGFSGLGSRQVLSPIFYEDRNKDRCEASTMVRPYDTLAYNQRAAAHLNNSNTIDPRSNMAVESHTSTRENVIGSNYLNKVWNGYKAALSNNPDEVDNPAYIMGAATDDPTLQEFNLAQSSMVFRRLREQTEMGTTNCVTIKELMYAFPEWNEVLDVKKLNPGLPQKVDNVAEWGTNSVAERVAHSLSLSIPALMATRQLASYSFTIENMSRPDKLATVLTTGYAFTVSLNREAHIISELENAIRTNIHGNIVGLGGIGDYSVVMSCNIIGSNHISVIVNGEHPVNFSAPSYCDAIYTPVVGSDTGALDTLSADIGNMLNSIYTTPGYY